MILLPRHSSIGRYSSVLIVNVEAYIIEKYTREWIDRLGFTSKEFQGRVQEKSESRLWSYIRKCFLNLKKRGIKLLY